MASLFLKLSLLLHRPLLGLAQAGPQPRQVPTSDSVYGPDGPWQAVSVQLGGQDLDLYPGGIYQSAILTKQLCQGIDQSPCGSGGLFDPKNSATIDQDSIQWKGDDTDATSEWTDGATLFSSTCNASSVRDLLQVSGVSVPNFSVKMYSSLKTVYPDGNYPPQVGALSLGPVINQTFTRGDEPAINASLIPAELAAQGEIPSSSFGLHVGIGAQALKLSLSLWLGGYDASRIVGPVSFQSIDDNDSEHLAIDLLDIGIGVDHGESPFSFTSQQGLLSRGNSSITSAGLSVLMNPGAPYLYLPNSTCAAIAKDLPVTYDIGKALYFWNIADPQYAKIVTSPTYLSFVFLGSSGNLTIKAPFQLLNLTLQAPLVSTEIPYFPCQPPQGPEGYFSLGRAFLQAAFVGVNWASMGENKWYLAQAPGPKLDTNPQSRPLTGLAPVGLGQEWADTWTGYWAALPTSATPVNSGSPSSPAAVSSALPTRSSTIPTRSLSGGAIAGIAVGGACAASITAGIGILLFRRRKDRNPEAVELTTVGKVDTHVSSRSLFPGSQGVGCESVSRSTMQDSIHELSVDNYVGTQLPCGGDPTGNPSSSLSIFPIQRPSHPTQ